MKKIEKQQRRAIKGILRQYSLPFLSKWSQTINFSVWMNEVDPSVAYRSPFTAESIPITIYHENGDVYTGSLFHGMKNGPRRSGRLPGKRMAGTQGPAPPTGAVARPGDGRDGRGDVGAGRRHGLVGLASPAERGRYCSRIAPTTAGDSPSASA